MRVAISTDQDYVSAHFGRCPSFTIVDFDKGKITRRIKVANPGHHPGFIPQFLNEKGVKCIIAGGMGARASGFFDELGIKIIVGVSGTVDETIAKLIGGTLVSGESSCRPGSGKGYGLDKTICDHPKENS